MNKNKGLLYLPVEVKVREMDSKLLLAYYAVKEGYQVIIGDHYMVELASEEYPNGIFFSKGYPHGFRKRVITHAKDNGHIIVELDEEGLLINEEKYFRDRMRREMLQFVTHEYCWGKYQKEAITRTYPEYEEKYHVVGNPRLDLLTSKFRSMYEEGSNRLIDEYGEFILINTRFSKYNTARGMKDNPHFKDIKKLYYLFLDMIKETCEKFPDTMFIVRPHPGENFQSYKQALADYNNVKVIHEGNIIKWLLAAKVVIHNGCTSGIEAYLLEKPLISYDPPISNKKSVSLPNKLGIKATSIAELHATLEEVRLKKDLQRNDKGFVNEKGLFDYLEWSNDSFSCENILQRFNSLHVPSKASEFFNLPNKSFRIKGKKRKKRIFSLTQEEIEDFFLKLDAIEGTKRDFVIKKLGNNLFTIHKF
ncbi:surface carbohydrate biosynthesis protein [Oceanobacillus senegalensis]|uniref:surface carbohydrate biosynthesis protein n=1 Tax=Oceanobacillus senegalensis TaxID=1936063 RepID=UPI000A30A21F|nr:surface carbohydrate biosynthesis protein [Oceanobacillus senegalensis]